MTVGNCCLQGLVRTSKEADVAVRFVTWFTDRGQAYEHNLHTLDRTLGRLAATSMPGRREPYDGRVRFTPASARSNEESRLPTTTTTSSPPGQGQRPTDSPSSLDEILRG